jgi:hypothetical protein
MHDLDLPGRDARELVADRDRVYELNVEDSRTLTSRKTLRSSRSRFPDISG